MGQICPATISFEEVEDLVKREYNYLSVPIFALMAIAILIGLTLIFCVQKGKTKPVFVKIIWLLITLTMFIEIAIHAIRVNEEAGK